MAGETAAGPFPYPFELSTLDGSNEYDRSGVRVSRAGDINGDGIDGGTTFDRYGLGNAEVRIEQGIAASSHLVIDLTSLSAAEGIIIRGNAAFDQAGFSVSGAA